MTDGNPRGWGNLSENKHLETGQVVKNGISSTRPGMTKKEEEVQPLLPTYSG